MNILGITTAPDSGATLIKGNKIIAAVNEERFTRIKLHQTFPFYSISYVIKEGGLSIDEIDVITCGSWAPTDRRLFYKAKDRISMAISQNPDSKKIIKDRINNSLIRDWRFREEIKDGLKKINSQNNFVYVDHHLSHAYTAFYCSPFKEALVLTIDGRGGFKSLTMSIASENECIKEVGWLSELDSIGYYYGSITSGLGFTPQKHEGKVTGLAAYGNPKICLYIMKNMIKWDSHNNKIVTNIGEWYRPFFKPLPPKLSREIKKNSKKDIAAACQYWLEQLVCNYLKKFLREYGIKNICLAGGVFANVKLNKRIRELEGIENVYIHPQMGDGGVGTGAALYTLYKNNVTIKKPLQNIYLGPSFSNEEIEELLKKSNYPYQEIKDKSKIAAELLEQNRVVGWFQGRMEYGPRALGNRSILFPAIDRHVNRFLNKRLHRTEFMPFAPVTLFGKAKECYIGWQKNHIASNFMTMCYDCTEKMKQETPGVVHVDGTARPQTIVREHNPIYYDIIKRYYEKTNLPSVINTSYNDHEEPIVCSPEDAIGSLSKGNVDIAIIGDFLVYNSLRKS